MFGKQKKQRLHDAIAAARTALAGSDEPGITAAYDELREAYFDLGFDYTDSDAQALLETFRERARSRETQRLESALTACRCCGSGDLLVAKHASLDDLYVANARTPLRFALVCCTACGDLRMWAPDVAALRELTTITDVKAFEPVTVPARPHPFR